MTHYVEVEVGAEIVKVEIDPIHLSGEIPASIEKITQRLSDAFNDAMKLIQVCGENVVTSVKKMSKKPTETSIEFGVKIDAEAGAIIAKASTEGHFIIKLSWQSQSETNSKNDTKN